MTPKMNLAFTIRHRLDEVLPIALLLLMPAFIYIILGYDLKAEENYDFNWYIFSAILAIIYGLGKFIGYCIVRVFDLIRSKDDAVTIGKSIVKSLLKWTTFIVVFGLFIPVVIFFLDALMSHLSMSNAIYMPFILVGFFVMVFYTRYIKSNSVSIIFIILFGIVVPFMYSELAYARFYNSYDMRFVHPDTMTTPWDAFSYFIDSMFLVSILLYLVTLLLIFANRFFHFLK